MPKLRDPLGVPGKMYDLIHERFPEIAADVVTYERNSGKPHRMVTLRPTPNQADALARSIEDDLTWVRGTGSGIDFPNAMIYALRDELYGVATQEDEGD